MVLRNEIAEREAEITGLGEKTEREPGGKKEWDQWQIDWDGKWGTLGDCALQRNEKHIHLGATIRG